MTPARLLVSSLFLPAFFLSTETRADAAGSSVLYFPEDVGNPAWVKPRQEQQLEEGKKVSVFHNFTFTDIQPKSGMDFLHRIVDDVGLDYKAVHYDHGNGIAAADVNLDGLIDIYLVSQAGPNGLYLNQGDGKFADATAAAGVALPDVIGVTASFADIDNDGDPDLYVTNVRSANRLFENLGDGTFKDISERSGLDYDGHSSSAIFFDYDRDGLLDLLLTEVGQYTTEQSRRIQGTPTDEKLENPPTYYVGFRDAFAGHLKAERERSSLIYRNLGGNRFSDQSEALGFSDLSWTGAATPTDFNNDGWPDLYLLNMQGGDQYWVNREGKKFERMTREVFPKTPWGSMGVKSFDFDNDGDMDLLLTDMHSDMSEKVDVDREKLKATWVEQNWSATFLGGKGKSIYGNALFRNDGAAGFTEVSDSMNTENYWPWGVSVGDLNADGWQDALLISSMNYPFRYAPNSLLLNQQGERFVDAEYLVGLEPRRDNRTAKPWIALDCDGIHADSKDCAGRDSDLTIYGALGSRSSVMLDMDGDGDLDIITSELGDVPQVLRSNLAEQKGDKLNYLAVRLVGTQSNRNALGAKVTVHAGDQKWVQVNDGQSGYLSQSILPLYFGLGDQSQVDRVEVVWPNGQQQSFDKIGDGNRVIELTEAAEG